MAGVICFTCGDPLHFVRGKGWVHPDGELVRVRTGRGGVQRDDHAAEPVTDYSRPRAPDEGAGCTS